MNPDQTLTVAGRYEQIQRICQFVAAGAAQAGLGETTVFHIELACDEACTNIIEHAYGGENKGELVVRWQVEGRQFIITIQDHGRPFDPTAVPPPSTLDASQHSAPEDIRVGGLGVHFMRQLMDEVHFQFDENENRLTLVKKISS
ncbi:MAG: ATP-binding protein [Chloroflexi bacterium]|nr:ATP-binding protein [Chloroflexota bacterium]